MQQSLRLMVETWHSVRRFGLEKDGDEGKSPIVRKERRPRITAAEPEPRRACVRNLSRKLRCVEGM